MGALISRFLPTLVPGLGALLNPWVLLGAVLVLAGAFFYGLHIGNDRLEDYKAAVAAAGKAQEAWSKQRAVDQQKLTKEKDREYERRMSDVSTKLAAAERRLRDNTRRGVLPPISGATAGSGAVGSTAICFRRAELDQALGEALQRLLTGSQKLIRDGEAARAVADTCTSWAVEQHRLSSEKPLP